jgi:formylmethanofuran dehydrogenase subunit E
MVLDAANRAFEKYFPKSWPELPPYPTKSFLDRLLGEKRFVRRKEAEYHRTCDRIKDEADVERIRRSHLFSMGYVQGYIDSDEIQRGPNTKITCAECGEVLHTSDDDVKVWVHPALLSVLETGIATVKCAKCVEAKEEENEENENGGMFV